MSFKKNLTRIIVSLFTIVLTIDILNSLLRNVSVMLLFFLTPIAVTFILLNASELKNWIMKKHMDSGGDSLYEKLNEEIKIWHKPFIPLVNQICEDIKQVKGNSQRYLNQIYGDNYLNFILAVIKNIEE